MHANINFIGCIRTPYHSLEDCPRNIQFDGPQCQLTIDEDYHGELRGLREGDNILVLYWLGRPKEGVGYIPLTDEAEPGTFAMRTPYRPNPIGAAVVPIESIEKGKLTVLGLDCLDKTELLDIKPAIFREPVSETDRPGLEGCDCDKLTTCAGAM